jgi:hypothetical protein
MPPDGEPLRRTIMTYPTLSTLDQDGLLLLTKHARGPVDSTATIAAVKEAVSRADATGAICRVGRRGHAAHPVVGLHGQNDAPGEWP